MPDIDPDFGAPGASGLIQIASWALGLCLIASFIALVLCIIAAAAKGFGNQQIQQGAAKGIIVTAIVTAALGSASVIWQFIVGFDLGIG